MWVLNDHINRWPTWTFGKSQLLFSYLRLGMAVPLGYAFSTLGNAAVMPAVAFLASGFPTATISSFGRRLVAKQLSLEPDAEGSISALQGLPAVDSLTADVFVQTRITSVDQLAYSNPVLLSVQTGLSFVFVTECMNQALLARYLRDGMSKATAFAPCGAQEATNLWKELTQDGDAKRHAEARIAEIVTALGSTGPKGLRAILSEVAFDPYSRFLSALWNLVGDSAPKTPLTENQAAA